MRAKRAAAQRSPPVSAASGAQASSGHSPAGAIAHETRSSRTGGALRRRLRPLRSSAAERSTRSTMRRRTLGSLMRDEGLVQLQALGRRQEVDDVGRAPALRRSPRCRSARRGAPSKKNETGTPGCSRSPAAGWRRSGSCPSRISGPAGRSGRALAELLLAHAEQHAPHAHPAADMRCRSDWAPSVIVSDSCPASIHQCRDGMAEPFRL